MDFDKPEKEFTPTPFKRNPITGALGVDVNMCRANEPMTGASAAEHLGVGVTPTPTYGGIPLGDLMTYAGYKLENEHSEGQLTKKHPNDAGLDIRASEDVFIEPRQSVIVHTGLYVRIFDGFVGIIKSRSGLSAKNDIEVGAGVIDSNYRGEISVKLYNHHRAYGFKIHKGDRIAQLLTIQVCLHPYLAVEILESSDRNNSGLGSTGNR